MGETARRYWPHALVAALTLGFIIVPGGMASGLTGVAASFLRIGGHVTLWGASACVVLCAIAALSPFGRRRLGGADAHVEFGTPTWLAMLFAAGMGAGLVFWGAAEPLIHAVTPPPGGAEPMSPQAIRDAQALTQMNWALHGWAIYAVAALAVALAAGKGSNDGDREAPLPSLPFRALPPMAHKIIDWTALIAVLFGVVASLGQGVFQLGAGTAIVTGGTVGEGIPLYLGWIGLLAAAYLVSTATGLSRGIAILSIINVVLALMLAAFVFVAAGPAALGRGVAETFIAYVSDLPRLSVDLRPEGSGRQWTRDWTLTYLLWWVAWSPFMGVFVARISRGRTVRTFIAGTVLVPSLATLVWFAIFGGAAVGVQASGVDLGVTDFATAPKATYVLLAELPLAALTQALTLLLVFLFLVTSADSGAYVLGLFSRNGEPPVGERLYWGVVLAALTAGAVWSAGGQSVTRAFAVTGAIPLCVLLAAQAITVVKEMARQR